MAQTDVKDISKSQREKNRRRDMHKLLGLASLFVIVLGLYASRDRWLSKVSTDSILLMKQDEITGENFPLSVSNNTGYQTCRFGEGFAVLSDTKLYIYSGDGKIIETIEDGFFSDFCAIDIENAISAPINFASGIGSVELLNNDFASCNGTSSAI